MKTITLAIAWIWVAVPLGWGVHQSVRKSMPLFSGPSAPTPPTASRRAIDRLRDRPTKRFPEPRSPWPQT